MPGPRGNGSGGTEGRGRCQDCHSSRTRAFVAGDRDGSGDQQGDGPAGSFWLAQKTYEYTPPRDSCHVASGFKGFQQGSDDCGRRIETRPERSSFLYQAASWSTARRVMAKVEF